MNKTESIVVNVFSAKPEDEEILKPFSYTQEKERLSEEKFYKQFGIESIHLDFKESLIRGRKIEDLFTSELTVEEEKIILDIAIKIGDLLGKYRIKEIFCPKATRNHVDHYIVKKSIEKLISPVEIYYYEDAPLFTKSKAKEETVKNLKEISIDISSVLEEKIQALLLYPNTIKAHYTSVDSIVKALRKNPVERYWRVIE
jgi:hypothetical protein